MEAKKEPPVHTAVITCGECGRTMQIALGLARAIGCPCGAVIILGEDEDALDRAYDATEEG